jgi:activator of 2-hydroxyglutaryl-CoA dehydratase/predicted nucleotide-binding protein (sugar kinase/HSP70/actin superfamily)
MARGECVEETFWRVGIDVGSTTVKAVVMDPHGAVCWKKYQRHNTRQAHQVRDFMREIEGTFDGNLRVFMTGSGARALSPLLNARYIQEVNAVTLAVERHCPGTGSAIELGGQDSKVVFWREDGHGRKTTTSYMNDKCAGGTGATIDKILKKIGISHEEAARIRLDGKTVHHIAAKCGVFAETDIVGLLKSGMDREEIVLSLFTAIVRQNLEVLVHGNVLRDRVVLLGGPHRFLPGFAEIWRQQIPLTWKLHGWNPADRPLDESIYIPDDAHYFAAIGAVLFAMESEEMMSSAGRGGDDASSYKGLERIDYYLREGRLGQLMASGAVKEGLVSSPEELASFRKRYTIPPFRPAVPKAGSKTACHIGIDGGSTSSKLVLLDLTGEPFYKDYVLSRGNPIEDVREMFGRLREWARKRRVELDVRGTAITGYASAILKHAFNLDLAVVETVAHMKSTTRLYGDVDIICDIGGQDIKVLFLKHGRVVDFKLNTQCSAGNGFFLQSMAEQFGIPIDRYADRAFKANKAPAFNYGCAVFMEQDRVNFQQLGWTEEEIMAGLALVLPLNIWNYVVQEPHVARFGRRFVLQGGTQKNLAAVKAQVDYIRSKVPEAEVFVHRHADISGAIGAALECQERLGGRATAFIGIEQASQVEFATRNDETSRCRFCKNACPRTFIDITSAGGRKVRFISGFGCERGMADNVEEMRTQERERKRQRERVPNLVALAASTVFSDFEFEPFPAAGTWVTRSSFPYGFGGPLKLLPKLPFLRSGQAAAERRRRMVVGLPKLLNLYFYAPFFSTYFRCAGVGGVRFSDCTSERLWSEGNKFGAIDPCFPAKVAPAHILNLLGEEEITQVCFPIITHLESQVTDTLGNNACVIQMGTPEVVEAAFTKSRDRFRERNVEYWKPLVRMDKPLEAAGLLHDYFGSRLGLTAGENAWAVRQGFAAMRQYLSALREAGRRVLNDLIEQDRMGIVMLGHPYHHDPGLNHGILEEFQMRGFPILCIESLPVDREFLAPLFPGYDADKEKLAAFDIQDVWRRNFNRNTNLKIWAAKVVARHPNLAAVDLSSFKCGHDAPTYSYVDSIMDGSMTPHFLIHDIDQNKPRASIAIRIQTIDYFLRFEEERLRKRVRDAGYG